MACRIRRYLNILFLAYFFKIKSYQDIIAGVKDRIGRIPAIFAVTVRMGRTQSG